MRRFIAAAASTLLLTTGLAEAGEPVQIVPFAAEGLMPRPAEVEVSRVPIFEIGAGAVIGVIAANVISGGMITPILMGAGFGMPAGVAAAAAPVAAGAVPAAVAALPAAAAGVAAPVVAATSATMVAAHAGIIVVGGAIGAAVGNWLFGTSQ
jgi:hypothetical protein